MKILVITFSKGLNPGTFMQAYGVKTGLLKAFPNADISYLNFPDFKRGYGRSHEKRAIISTIKQKALATYRLLKYMKLEKETFNYTKRIDLFNYDKSEARNILSGFDLIAVGSDTILEKAMSDDNKQIGLNWAAPLLCSAKCIFFSASAAPAHFSEDRATTDMLSECVKLFKFIGLRDELTINLFKNKFYVDASSLIKQPDPSFFLDIQQFCLGKFYLKKLKGKKVVLCNFNAGFPQRKEMANGLRGLGYFVISTQYNPYADLSIATIDAIQWAGVFKEVRLVVTERFHDTVFGLRNEKPVIAIDWELERFSKDGDSKTLRILEDYGHGHLHFNLCETRNIAPILNVCKNIDNLFDIDKVKQTNTLQKQKLDEVISRIKNII